MDHADTEILKLLQRDATLSNQAIGEKVGMSHSSVWRRIEAMEKAGIILRRAAILDPVRAGLSTTAVTEVSLRDHGPEARAAFERFVQVTPEIMTCYSVTGRHDYRLEIRLADIQAYEAFLMEQLLAHDAVASAETSFVLRPVKYTTELPL